MQIQTLSARAAVVSDLKPSLQQTGANERPGPIAVLETPLASIPSPHSIGSSDSACRAATIAL